MSIQKKNDADSTHLDSTTSLPKAKTYLLASDVLDLVPLNQEGVYTVLKFFVRHYDKVDIMRKMMSINNFYGVNVAPDAEPLDDESLFRTFLEGGSNKDIIQSLFKTDLTALNFLTHTGLLFDQNVLGACTFNVDGVSLNGMQICTKKDLLTFSVFLTKSPLDFSKTKAKYVKRLATVNTNSKLDFLAGSSSLTFLAFRIVGYFSTTNAKGDENGSIIFNDVSGKQLSGSKHINYTVRNTGAAAILDATAPHLSVGLQQYLTCLTALMQFNIPQSVVVLKKKEPLYFLLAMLTLAVSSKKTSTAFIRMFKIHFHLDDEINVDTPFAKGCLSDALLIAQLHGRKDATIFGVLDSPEGCLLIKCVAACYEIAVKYEKKLLDNCPIIKTLEENFSDVDTLSTNAFVTTVMVVYKPIRTKAASLSNIFQLASREFVAFGFQESKVNKAAHLMSTIEFLKASDEKAFQKTSFILNKDSLPHDFIKVLITLIDTNRLILITKKEDLKQDAPSQVVHIGVLTNYIEQKKNYFNTAESKIVIDYALPFVGEEGADSTFKQLTNNLKAVRSFDIIVPVKRMAHSPADLPSFSPTMKLDISNNVYMVVNYSLFPENNSIGIAHSERVRRALFFIMYYRYKLQALFCALDVNCGSPRMVPQFSAKQYSSIIKLGTALNSPVDFDVDNNFIACSKQANFYPILGHLHGVEKRIEAVDATVESVTSILDGLAFNLGDINSAGKKNAPTQVLEDFEADVLPVSKESDVIHAELNDDPIIVDSDPLDSSSDNLMSLPSEDDIRNFNDELAKRQAAKNYVNNSKNKKKKKKKIREQQSSRVDDEISYGGQLAKQVNFSLDDSDSSSDDSEDLESAAPYYTSKRKLPFSQNSGKSKRVRRNKTTSNSRNYSTSSKNNKGKGKFRK